MSINTTTYRLDKRALGVRINQRLKDLNLKKGQLAKELERDKTRISAYLRGEEITIDTLFALATILHCSVDSLMGIASPEHQGNWPEPKELRHRLVEAVKRFALEADVESIEAVLGIIKRFEELIGRRPRGS